jgi:hypothetical protein
LEKDKSINYLFDYTKYLIRNNQTDEKILNWQAENSSLLKPLGLDFKKMKEVKLIKIKKFIFRNYKKKIRNITNTIA